MAKSQKLQLYPNEYGNGQRVGMGSMKSIISVMPLFWFVVIAGCGDDGKDKTAETVLKTQRDTLTQAKKIDQMMLDAASKQRENIDKETE